MEDSTAFDTTNTRIAVGMVLLLLGFIGLITLDWAWWSLFLGGILAWGVMFQSESRFVLKMPKQLWIIPLGILIYFIYGILVSRTAEFLGFNWAGSSAVGHLGQLIWILPFMLMGEELLGIGVLEAAKSKGLSFLTSTFISALVFGLIHIFAYWDGSIVSTLLHVLLLQSVARLIFNSIYIRSGRSIWGSWTTHMLVDILALYLAATFG